MTKEDHIKNIAVRKREQDFEIDRNILEDNVEKWQKKANSLNRSSENMEVAQERNNIAISRERNNIAISRRKEKVTNASKIERSLTNIMRSATKVEIS